MLAVEEFHLLRRRKASARYVRNIRNSPLTCHAGERIRHHVQFVSVEAASPPASATLGALPRLLALPPPMKACGHTVA